MAAKAEPDLKTEQNLYKENQTAEFAQDGYNCAEQLFSLEELGNMLQKANGCYLTFPLFRYGMYVYVCLKNCLYLTNIRVQFSLLCYNIYL